MSYKRLTAHFHRYSRFAEGGMLLIAITLVLLDTSSWWSASLKFSSKATATTRKVTSTPPQLATPRKGRP